MYRCLCSIIIIHVILLQVVRPHARSDGFIGDYCDGELFRTHPHLQQYPDSLVLVAYYDDIEICNPLGSHAGVHKLGEEFWQNNY